MKLHFLLSCFLLLPVLALCQQQEEIQLDSCVRFNENNIPVFSDVHIRVSQPARWASKMGMEDFFKTYFSKYLQKKAGGKITLSLLITKRGEVCFYKAQPNSNVRPDYKELKALLDQTKWQPALQGGEPVTSLKVLFLQFDGKQVSVTELE